MIDPISREKELEGARNRLKSLFVGLDSVIDSLIDKLKIWWCYPDYLTRPTVISMYGTTGTGKTELILELIKALKLENVSGVYEFGCDNTYVMSNIMYTLTQSNIHQMTQGVLLVDEIQKMGNQYAQERGRSTTDLWRLLSSGRLVTLSENLNDLVTFIDDIQTKIRKANNENMTSEEMMRSRIVGYHANRLARFFSEKDAPFIWSLKYLYEFPNYTKDYQFVSKYKDSPLYMRMLFSTLSNQTILEMLTIKYNDYMVNRSKMKDDDFVYKKLLIIIAGNLDNLFIPKEKNEWEYTCDELIAYNNTITNNKIKQELLSIFRPEQVSRFGNNYIKFPSLSEQDYLKVVQKSFDTLREKILKTGVDISQYITVSEIFEEIKERGFYPSQGVRPVLTEFDCIMSEILPKIMIQQAQHTGVNHHQY